MITGTLKN